MQSSVVAAKELALECSGRATLVPVATTQPGGGRGWRTRSEFEREPGCQESPGDEFSAPAKTSSERMVFTKVKRASRNNLLGSVGQANHGNRKGSAQQARFPSGSL